MKKEEEVRIMTLDEAVILCLSTYPSLYTDASWDKVRFKVIDSIFNAIGSGVDDMKDFKSKYSLTKKNKKLMKLDCEKYITKEPLYYAYKKSENSVWGQEHAGIFNNNELKILDDVEKIIICNDNVVKNPEKYSKPYPYFKKTYSIIWNDIPSLKTLDNSWLEGF